MCEISPGKSGEVLCNLREEQIGQSSINLGPTLHTRVYMFVHIDICMHMFTYVIYMHIQQRKFIKILSEFVNSIKYFYTLPLKASTSTNEHGLFFLLHLERRVWNIHQRF